MAVFKFCYMGIKYNNFQLSMYTKFNTYILVNLKSESKDALKSFCYFDDQIKKTEGCGGRF